MLERIAKELQAFILKQGWASVSLDGARGLMELRSLYEHLQARILGDDRAVFAEDTSGRGRSLNGLRRDATATIAGEVPFWREGIMADTGN